MTISADYDAYGKLRPAPDVQSGWYVRTDDGWFEVGVYVHSEIIVTGQKIVRFYFTDGSHMGVDRSAQVMCRTAAEAKRAAKAEAASGGEAR